MDKRLQEALHYYRTIDEHDDISGEPINNNFARHIRTLFMNIRVPKNDPTVIVDISQILEIENEIKGIYDILLDKAVVNYFNEKIYNQISDNYKDFYLYLDNIIMMDRMLHDIECNRLYDVRCTSMYLYNRKPVFINKEEMVKWFTANKSIYTKDMLLAEYEPLFDNIPDYIIDYDECENDSNVTISFIKPKTIIASEKVYKNFYLLAIANKYRFWDLEFALEFPYTFEAKLKISEFISEFNRNYEIHNKIFGRKLTSKLVAKTVLND